MKQLLAAEPDLDDATRARLTEVLQSSISLISTRYEAERALPPPEQADTDEMAELAAEYSSEAEEVVLESVAIAAEEEAEPFDPYSPNVIVVFRTRGRDAALEELHSIDDIERLRLLAREQQLGISSDLVDPTSIRQAIVAAAERRITNRRAAAS